MQFVTTFRVWITAERLGLSPVVTLVVFGMTAARRGTLAARLRVSTFATWEAVTFVLNVLAFTLIGLRLGPILEALSGAQLARLLGVALLILTVVIVVRLLWVMTYTLTARSGRPSPAPARRPVVAPLSPRGGLVIGWAGMRGIVTLAAAAAFPDGFPYRDIIQLTAFVVVLGTLVQGLTLCPLLVFLRLPPDTAIEGEVRLAHKVALKAALQALDGDGSAAAQRLQLEYREELSRAWNGEDPQDSPDNTLRRQTVEVARQAIHELRHSGKIGDAAYHLVEQELDWLEMSTQTATAPEV